MLVTCNRFLSSLQRTSRRYYPTRLAITLSAGVTTNSASSTLGATPGTGDTSFIVVETNYRLYAYTSMCSYQNLTLILNAYAFMLMRIMLHLLKYTSCLYLLLSGWFPDSELQIALVALFSEMLYRFPNVVVAQVTRESVQQAIANGITAQQVG